MNNTNEAALRDAANARYPRPDSPHGSVMQLWHNNQVAFQNGYRAALAATATVAKDGKPADNLLDSHINHTAKTLYTTKPEASSEQPAGKVAGYPYQELFDAIGDAVGIQGNAKVISVKAFVNALQNKGYRVAPTSEDTGKASEAIDQLAMLEEIARLLALVLAQADSSSAAPSDVT